MVRKNDLEMYLTQNEEKPVMAERFIRILKNKVYKYSKYVYIGKLDDIVNKYNNTYHITIKIKPFDLTSNTYIDSSKEINDKKPKSKIGDIVRISKYKNVFAKDYTPNWFEDIFLITKVKNTVPRMYVINNLNREKIFGAFYRNELQKPNQKEFRTKKVIKKKGDKLYIKWKRYNNSFNSLIDKKGIV